jgi:hypothetical protein
VSQRDVVVVGGGAAGLATARALQRRGLDHVVLEADEVAHVWGRHYRGMRTNTLRSLSSLPGLRMPRTLPSFPSGPQVRDYLSAYRDRFDLDVRTGVRVDAARRSAPGWRLSTNRGDWSASVLVAATGIWSAPVWPDIVGLDEFAGTLLHSSEFHDPADHREQRVLVIGAGNSGSEIGAALAGAGVDTTVSVRGPVLFLARPRRAPVEAAVARALTVAPDRVGDRVLRRLARDHRADGFAAPEHPSRAFPVIGEGLPEAVAAGLARLAPGVESVSGDRVRFDDGRVERYDVVVAATGYRPALDWLDPNSWSPDPRGRPLVDRWSRSIAERRLSCVGFDYPPWEGWLQTIGRVAQRAATGAARTIAAPDPTG